jgi:ABC-type branched-subunit amino acid transport system substrate-binding protein
MERRTFLKTVGAGGIAGLAGCADQSGSGGGETTTESGTDSSSGDESTTTPAGTTTGGGGADVIRIGAYGPFTGPASNIGEAMQQGLELAQQMLNENGGMAGHEVELYFGDSESEPATGRSAVEYLINQNDVDIVAGGFHSDVSLATVEVTNSAGVPQMISNSVSGAINEKMESQDMQNVFKMSPPSEAYGVGWAGYINDLQSEEVGYFPYESKNIAMIGESTSYGTSVMEATSDYVSEAGWNVVSTDEVAVDETNFRSLLTRIKSNDPDVVWAVQTAPSPAANLVKQYRELGFQNTHFMHTFIPSNPEYINLAGDAADGVLWMSNIGVIPTYVDEIGLRQAWQDTYDAAVPGSSGSLPWDNLMIIDEVMQEIGSVEDLTVDSWAETVVELDPITGSAGNFDWTADGPFHQALYGKDTIPAIGSQIQDGQSQFVWPFSLADNEIDSSYY